ncbi:excinuclease ABC subunit UvrC [bacterium]|nr:excinuclease ABC subunit UvrC [bacterium]
MTENLKQKLAELPKSPGVYFHKNKSEEIIYVGKAANLRNRVRQYFQNSRVRDAKTDALVSEITDVDWMEVDSELEALFLEAEMIRRYMPQYNILLRDDKSMVYIRIDFNNDYPTVTTTRRPLDDGAKYYGPYLSALSVRQALKILRRIFPFATQKPIGQKRASLDYHLGLDPGLEEQKTSLQKYRGDLKKLISIIEGKRLTIIRELEKDMNKAAKNHDFEKATILRNQIYSLKGLNRQVIFSDKEFQDISKDHAINELVSLLGLKKPPYRIEGFDISHMQGSDVVASMVVFTNGVSNKAQYRKFKTRLEQNNDFYNMQETLSRRLSVKNINAWGVPDLLLIDGGKGQLDAALKARDDQGQNHIPMIGLAKRQEQVIVHAQKSNVVIDEKILMNLGGYKTSTKDYITINLPETSNLIKLLQRIRDESHRFAVSFHSVLKIKRQTKSLLDDIPTIGPASRKKLLKNFGSLKQITLASENQLADVVGQKKAKLIKDYLS